MHHSVAERLHKNSSPCLDLPVGKRKKGKDKNIDFLEREHLNLKSCGDRAKAIHLPVSLYMIQKPQQQQRYRSERTSLGHGLGMSAPRGTTLDCPGSVVLAGFGASSWAVLIPSSMSEKKAKIRSSQQLLSSTLAGAEAGSWSCHGYTAGAEWESLTSFSARDGRMAD